MWSNAAFVLFPLRTVRGGWGRSRHRSDDGATNGSEEPRGPREQLLVEKFATFKMQANTCKEHPCAGAERVMSRTSTGRQNSNVINTWGRGNRGRAPLSCQRSQCQPVTTIMRERTCRNESHQFGMWSVSHRSVQWSRPFCPECQGHWNHCLRVRSHRKRRQKKLTALQRAERASRTTPTPAVPWCLVRLSLRHVLISSSPRRRPSTAARPESQGHMGIARLSW